MSFKKWMITFFISMFITACFLCAFNLVVDPFGVFGDKVLKWYSYDMVNNPRVAKIAYLDQYHDRYNSYIIGGSKSSSISPELLDKYYGGDTRFYSMLMYGGDFFDYEKTLYYLVDHYVVKNIVIHMSMQEINHYHTSSDLKQKLHAKVSGESAALFYLKYLTLNPKYSFAKLEGYAKRAVDPFQFSQIKPEDGVYNKVKRDAEKIGDVDSYLAENQSFNLPMGTLSAVAMDQNVQSLKRMKEYCKQRNINFLFVTGATYSGEMASYNLDDLKAYWEKLAAVTDFWDFSGYTSISNDPRNFYDSMHYRNSVGKMMLAYMFKDHHVDVPAGFGHHTTRDNVNGYVEKVFNKPAFNGSSVVIK